jgi:DNA-directed RNA polymerase specialized sigma24 family protein
VKTEIAVALIAATGVGVQATVSYLVNRRTAIDLRTNIGREIDIVRKLQPSSPEAQQLETHIKDAVEKLISTEQKRDSASAVVRLPVRFREV